jgi:hypothetical protein
MADQSTAVDVDTSILLVSEVGPSDNSGLTPGADTVDLSPTDIRLWDGAGNATMLQPHNVVDR